MPDSPKDFVDQIMIDKSIQAARQRAIDPPAKTRSSSTNGASSTNSTAKQKWLDARLHGVCDDVRSTPEPGRNARLRWGARQLGEVAHHGLDESRCKRELERAAEDNGLWREDGAHQCKASIESGWNKGISDPKDIDHVGTQTGTSKNGATHGSAKTEPAKTNGHAPETLERSVKLVRLDTVRTTVPQWVWTYNGKGRIQLGTLSIFAGKPAAGKSTAVRWFAAKLSRGELEGVWEGHPMKVAVVMMEEQLDAIVVPGLIAAGADRSMVFNPQFKFGDTESTMMSQADEQRLTDIMVDNGVRALFIDPIMQTLGARTDAYRNNEVRAAMAPYTRIAQAINGIVVGVTHLKKGEVKEVLGNINGSSAFGEIPRSVFGFSPIPGSSDHVLEQVKNSAGQPGLKLAYQLPVQHLTADDGQPIELPTFEIKGETEQSITDIAASEGETTKISVAREWLQMYLEENQPAPSAQVKKDAKNHGDIGDRLIGRAAESLGVVIKSRSFPDRPYTTVWMLPSHKDVF